MSLADVRSKFVEITGRADLTTPGLAVGTDFYINEAQKMLDRMLDGGKTGAVYPVNLEQGSVLVLLPSARVVNKVYVSDVVQRTELKKIDIQRIMSTPDLYFVSPPGPPYTAPPPDPYWFNQPIANMQTTRPRFYSPTWIRPFPGTQDITQYSQQWIFEHLLDIGHENFNGLIVFPPPDLATYTLEVWGKFYSDQLVNDEDRSWWTEVHPMLLVKAAAYQVEITYRNTEGAKDWLGAPNMPGTILGDIKDLNMDIYEEECAEVSRMEG